MPDLPDGFEVLGSLGDMSVIQNPVTAEERVIFPNGDAFRFTRIEDVNLQLQIIRLKRALALFLTATPEPLRGQIVNALGGPQDSQVGPVVR